MGETTSHKNRSTYLFKGNVLVSQHSVMTAFSKIKADLSGVFKLLDREAKEEGGLGWGEEKKIIMKCRGEAEKSWRELKKQETRQRKGEKKS